MKVLFIYNKTKNEIYCHKEDYIKDIYKKYALKIKVDIDSIYFLYNGNIINEDLKFKDNINQINNDNNEEITIYVENIIQNDKNLINLKDIICPKCGEKTKNEKCKNGHNIINEIKNLRKKIDVFKNSINEIINKLKEVIENIENIYHINYNLNKNNEKEDLNDLNTSSLIIRNLVKNIDQINDDFNINNKIKNKKKS